MVTKFPEINNSLNTFWLNLANKTNQDGEDLQILFNKMAADSSYTGQDIVKYFSEYITDNAVSDAIIQAYVNSSNIIK